MPKRTEPAIFHIDFSKGKANRNRLPLAHVVEILQEFDLMIREVGKKIQRDNGVENPDGDFGIELLAGATGIAFAKGSFRTANAITKDVENGLLAVSHIIGTTGFVERKKSVSVDEYGMPIVRRLSRVAEIQEQDQTEIRLKLAKQGKVTDTALFTNRGIQAIKSLGEAELAIEAITVYGKLKKLADYSKDDEHTVLGGTLIEDNGNEWRVRFLQTDLKKVQRLFTKQVVVSGDASYFRTRTPRLDAKTVDEDRERDFVAGYKRFRKDYRDVFGDRDTSDILKDIRG